MSLINLIRSALVFAALFELPSVEAGDLNIYFKASPGFEHVRPYADPATMSLLITDELGRPVTEGKVSIRLDAPRPGSFFSTDFPWVEGTRLYETQLTLRQGRANWKYLFPIRGEYRLGVDAATADGKSARNEFFFKVRENETKWLALAAFSAGLFFLGLIAGRVFTGVPTVAGAAVVFALLGSWWAHAAPDLGHDSETAALDIESARVGQATAIRWHPNGGAAGANSATLLSLRITHLEKEKTAFEIERVPVLGDFTMKFQFTDGAEYRVAAIGEQPGQPPLRSEKLISATAVEPPTRAMVPAFAYFIGLIVIGLLVGRWSKRGRRSSEE